MSTKKSISFLYAFDLGNRHIDVPTQNILHVTSTAEGDFNIANITTDALRNKWRSASALTKQEIIIKAEKKSEIDCFAILGHNFTPEALIQVQANISNNFLAPPVTITAAWGENNIVIPNSFGGQYQYYKISILDPANPCGFVEIGRVIGGKLLQLTHDEDITDSYKIGYKDLSESMKTQGYFRASNENIVQRTFDASFSKLHTQIGSNDNFMKLRKFFHTVKTIQPFLTILEIENPYKFNMWGQLTDIPNESFGVNDYVSFPLKVEESF
jgi:hypothetical protein